MTINVRKKVKPWPRSEKVHDVSMMNEKLRSTIKKIMKARGVTQAELAQQLQVSPATVKRALNSDDFSIGRLTEISRILGINLLELMQIAENIKVEGSQMSREQEEYLAENPRCASVLWRLVNGFTVKTIAKESGETIQQVMESLFSLEKIGLVRKNNDNFRPTVSWPIGFTFKGPLHIGYSKKMLYQFVDHLYSKVKLLPAGQKERPDFSLRIMQLIVRQKTYEEFREDLAKLIERYLTISRAERAVENESNLQTVSILSGMDAIDIVAATFEGVARVRRKDP